MKTAYAPKARIRLIMGALFTLKLLPIPIDHETTSVRNARWAGYSSLTVATGETTCFQGTGFTLLHFTCASLTLLLTFTFKSQASSDYQYVVISPLIKVFN